MEYKVNFSSTSIWHTSSQINVTQLQRHADCYSTAEVFIIYNGRHLFQGIRKRPDCFQVHSLTSKPQPSAHNLTSTSSEQLYKNPSTCIYALPCWVLSLASYPVGWWVLNKGVHGEEISCSQYECMRVLHKKEGFITSFLAFFTHHLCHCEQLLATNSVISNKTTVKWDCAFNRAPSC